MPASSTARHRQPPNTLRSSVPDGYSLVLQTLSCHIKNIKNCRVNQQHIFLAGVLKFVILGHVNELRPPVDILKRQPQRVLLLFRCIHQTSTSLSSKTPSLISARTTLCESTYTIDPSIPKSKRTSSTVSARSSGVNFLL